MTERATAPLRARLHREHAVVRRAVMLRHALRAFAGVAVLLSGAVIAGLAVRAGVGAASARLALFVLAALAVLGWTAERTLATLPRFDAWMESLEDRFPALRSWLRNALDLESAPDTRTSAALAGALRDEAANRLGATPLATARPAVRPRGPLLLALGATAAIALAAAIAPHATLRSWRTLWDPTLAAPPVSLAVEPGSVQVAPGATLSIRARVGGTDAAPKLLGDGARPVAQLEAVEHGVHRWRFDLPPVTRARRYAVRVVRTSSPEYRIDLAGQPQPVSFSFDYRAPAYARLPVQSGTSTSGDLAALRGSVADVEVTFDRDLEALSATVRGGAARAWSAITPRRWRGHVPVDADGEWTLRAESSTGGGTWRWRVSALADAPPVITVARPGGDQDLPSGSQVPYDVLVQDDLGLSDLRLQWRKEATRPWTDVPIAAFSGQPREAHVAAGWDAGVLGLLPGETGTFRFVVRDNDRVGGPGVATSSEFRLRFPSMADLYRGIDQRQDRAAQTLRQVADQARELQKTLDQLQRQQPRAGVQSPPQYERTEEMRKALERQQALAEQLEKAAAETHQAASDAAERQAFRDQLQQKMHEMSELMQQIQSPEFKQAMERMRQALEKMDRTATERELPKLRDANREMLQNLERNLALLRQLRDEERIDALARRAEELKARQDALNREHQALARPDAPPRDGQSPQQQREDAAQQQREAAQESQQLAKDARDAAAQTASPDSKQDLESAAQELEQQAASDQQQAAEQSQSGQSGKAQKSGEQASESLSRAGERMARSSSMEQQMRQARQLAAVRRSAQDLVSLGQEATRNMSSSGSSSQSSEEQAGRQTDLSEGVARVADSLASLAQETPLLSPQVQQSLGKAMQNLQQSGRELSQGNRARGQQMGDGATAALREAVAALRDAESSMCQKGGQQPGPGPGSRPTPGERLGQLGQQQGQLNERSSELARRLSQAMRLSEGDQGEMRRLAEEQARLRSELEDIQREDQAKHQLLGRLDQAQHDMQDVEEELRQGLPPSSDLEERQNRILSRLLDAQRSINRRDFDPQRESRPGEDVARVSPAPLPAAMLRESDRLRLDLMKADADRYPAQYRALIERYLQRLNGSPQ